MCAKLSIATKLDTYLTQAKLTDRVRAGATMNINCSPDYLSFAGSIIGALAGIGAAFLAVYLAQHYADKRDLKTLRELLAEFADCAADMDKYADTNPVKGSTPALVHYRATRDAAIGMRTRGAAAAKVAARLETDQVGIELNRLHMAREGAVCADLQGRAGELRQLGRDLLAVLKNGL